MRHYGICIPNNMASGKAFEDLDLSKEEVKRLGEALKDEKFRKMLAEYAEEISDPENRRKAEEEIAMMENERGMNVQFIHPNPGHVLKTTVDRTTKAFINICQNDKIDKPVAKREKGPTGKSGLMWQIPHSFAPPRDDLDKSKQKCKVFDVVFHPDTYRMASSNERFLKLVEDTAVEGIEKQFNVSLDKKNIRRPKCSFKGQPVSTVIRERIPDNEVKSVDVDPDSVLSKMPYPYDKHTTSEKNKAQVKSEVRIIDGKSKEKSVSGSETNFTEPKYTITHRSEVDMSEYRNAPDAKVSTRPKELVVKISLPLLKSAADASLDIFEKKLILESVSPAVYKLDLNLPYPVNEDEGYAKFDKSKKTLTITLPVIPETISEIPFIQREESNSLMDTKEDQKISEKISVISETLNHGKDESDLEPKVEESKENENANATDSRSQMNGKINLPENVKWLLPEYDISQDDETISIVLKVQCVEERSIVLTFPEQRSAKIKFMSIGAGCFPSYYSLQIEFCEGCHISSEHSNVDVSDDNLVLVLLKNKGCRGLWDFFSIGADKDNLEIKQFLTESNLKRELSALDEAAEEEEGMPMQEQQVPELAVLEMSADKLTMEIKPQKKNTGKKSHKQHQADDEEDDEYDDYDPPSSAEIEVIHKQPAPLLHSILKQRTVSESSEDHSLSVEPESPRSGEEEDLSSSCGKRRTVSFNNHVDRASYKSNASVSSMAPALKSKRKKQRRREVKMQRGRRHRHNSEGTSSSEDHLCKDSWSDSYSMSEEDGEDTEKTKLRTAALQRANSDPGPSEEHDDAKPYEREDKTRKTKDENDKDKDDDALRTSMISNSSKCLDFRTKHNGAEDVHDVSEGCESVVETVMKEGNSDQLDRNKKMVQEIKGKLQAAKITDVKNIEEEKRDSDDDDDDDNTVDEYRNDLKGHGEGNERGINTKIRNDASECESGETIVGKVSGNVDEVECTGVNDHEKREESDSHKKNEKDEKGKSTVKTMLSWDDKSVNGDEHKTQCAFAFSNNLMFDLDME